MTPPDPGPLTARSARVRSARRLRSRSVRAERREFLAEGPQAVREALAAPGVAIEVFVTEAAAARHPDLREIAEPDVAWWVVDERAVDALADTMTPQGLLARCRCLDVSLPDLLVSEPALVAVLVDVRDPGNAGTVLRSADAAGAGGVILAGASVDPYNPKAVRASAGSLFHLPIAVARDAGPVLPALRQRGMTVLAADGCGDVELGAASGIPPAGPTAWVFGNEAHGLPKEIRDDADAVVRVPILGRAESLNLATAAAVCLYASAFAQRCYRGSAEAAPR